MPSNRPEILVLSNQTLSLLVRGYAASKLSSLSRQYGHSSVWGCKIFKGIKTAKSDYGDAGYRSPYLSHAKRALYHLSYIPI
ncbi:hypothetical protein QYF36_000777 [Acer negundo]|nr:hypothetical protein QYF36_000777 [Acer negundo]